MKLYKKIIPTKYATNVSEINYTKLKEQGITTLFFDLDNTLIPYDIDIIPTETKTFLENLNLDFKVVVVSNSRIKRVSKATSSLDNIDFVKFATKPWKRGFKKALKKVNSKPNETAVIGDQLMTDIFGANRLKMKDAILVFPIKKRSDHFLTRINRKIENHFIKKIKKKQPDKYEEVLSAYVNSK